jgi:alpha-tubulin suppressor-like RCC1 family protein
VKRSLSWLVLALALLTALVPVSARADVSVWWTEASIEVGETAVVNVRLSEGAAGDIGLGSLELSAPAGFEFEAATASVTAGEGAACPRKETMLRLGPQKTTTLTIDPAPGSLSVRVSWTSKGRCYVTLQLAVTVRALEVGEGLITLGGTSAVKGVAAGSAVAYLVATPPPPPPPWAYTWGSNLYGEAGVGYSGTSVTEPYRLPLSGVTAVAAGERTSFAALADGTVWGWGANFGRVLGASRPSEVGEPVQIAGIDGVTALSAGYGHVVALRSDGSVWTWGGNWAGQLGDGSTADRDQPQPVAGLTDMVSVSAGRESSYAVSGDGSLYAWGGNTHGQQLNGTLYGLEPSPVVRMTGMTQVAAGDYFVLGLASDGTVWGGGNNDWGQLGTGTPSPDQPTPQRTQGLAGVGGIAAGDQSSFALVGGALWGWGMNGWGQTGVGYGSDSVAAPTPTTAPAGIVSVAAGSSHTHVVLADGSVWSVGSHYYGQLGVGTDAYYGSETWLPAHISGVTAVAAREDHSLAVAG